MRTVIATKRLLSDDGKYYFTKCYLSIENKYMNGLSTLQLNFYGSIVPDFLVPKKGFHFYDVDIENYSSLWLLIFF
jgi:hypothetical protein